jgi:hypothetical protein
MCAVGVTSEIEGKRPQDSAPAQNTFCFDMPIADSTTGALIRDNP